MTYFCAAEAKANELETGFHIVVEVRCIGTGGKSLSSDVWELCIIDQNNKVHQQSPQGYPSGGFHGNNLKEPYYILRTIPFGCLSSAKDVVKGLLTPDHHYGKVTDYYRDAVPESASSVTVTKEVPEFVKETQRQLRSNSDKITKLEKELKQARDLQKLLKTYRKQNQ